MKKSCLLFALLIAAANLQAATLFTDNFDSYSNGNLAGQGPWIQNGSSANTPAQINNGRVYLGTSGQDLNAPITPLSLVDATTFYIGATINLSAAQGGDYFLHWSPATGSSTFISRLFAKSSGSGFLLGYLETSGTGTTNYGTQTLNFNQDYRVVIAYDAVSGTLNDTARVYVDPTDWNVEGNNTPYLSDTWTTTTAEATTIGAINLRQGTASIASTVSIDNLTVATTFVEVVPEPSTMALAGLGLLSWALWRRRG
jgi:hypothetical protein